MRGRGKIALVIAASAIALVAIFAWRRAKQRHAVEIRPSPPAPLPVAANRLPKSTELVVQTIEKPDELPQERWSRAAGSACCGGQDVFALVMRALDPRESRDDLNRALSLPPEELKATLSCGKTLASSEKPASYAARFESKSADAGQRVGFVYLDSFDVDVLPSSTKPEKTRKCERIPDTRVWVSGELDDVSAYLTETGTPNDGKDTAIFESVANEFGPHETLHIVRKRDDFRYYLTVGLLPEPAPFMSNSAQAKALEEAMNKGFWAGATGRNASSYEGMIVATAEPEAETIERAWRDYLAEYGRRMTGDLPRVRQHGNVPEELLSESWRENRVVRRAWRGATVSRSGARVWIKMKLEPNAEELELEKHHREWLGTKKKAAARWIDALIEGRPAPREEIESTDAGSPPAPVSIRLDLPKPLEGDFYTPVDFETLGFRTEKLDATRSLVCGFDPSACVCIEPLPCEAKGNCPSFDENIAAFEKALVPGQERQVSCELAETGRAGDFKYFVFYGDIHRYEVRWFDRSGRLVGQRNTTDYSEYCDHKVSARFMGRIPAASETVRERVICGRPKHTLVPPLEDLRRLLWTGLLSPTSAAPP